MARRFEKEQDPVHLLERLMALDYDADEAFDAAIARLADPRYQEQLSAFKADHRRRLRELEGVIRRLGGDPPEGPDLEGRLEHGRMAITQLGGDDAILKAMRKNVQHAHEAYEEALERAPGEARDIVRRASEEEARHYEWLDSTVQKMENTRHLGVPPWNIPPPSGF